jgi:teichuronic acid biosynthesis glycosyltransferase TuaC
MNKNPRVLVIGPLPPAIGGIATFILDLLNSDLKDKFKLIPFATNRPLNKDSNLSVKYLLKCIIYTIYHMLIFPITLLRKKPDVIHIHTPSYWSFLENSYYVLISKLYQKKVILHIHGGAFDKFYLNSSFILKYYIKFIMSSSDRIISLSSYWRSFYINNVGINGNSITVVYNGFDSSIFIPMDINECRKNLNLSLDKKIILTVGNLVEEKGHEYLIEALSKLLVYRRDFICIIIGDGKLRNVLEEQIKPIMFNDCIFLLGKKPHEEIPLWMNAANLFVLPSLIEGNPIVMSESLGIGLPFVGTKIGAIPEIISANDYGLLVEPRNANDLAEVISVALDIMWDRVKIRQYAERFKWSHVSNDILNIYSQVIG